MSFRTVFFHSARGSNARSLFAFRCHISLVSLNLKQFLSLSVSVITLTLLRNTGQLFCRMPLNLRLSDVSSWLDLGYAFLAGIRCKHCWFFLVPRIRRHIRSVCPFTGESTFRWPSVPHCPHLLMERPKEHSWTASWLSCHFKHVPPSGQLCR